MTKCRVSHVTNSASKSPIMGWGCRDHIISGRSCHAHRGHWKIMSRFFYHFWTPLMSHTATHPKTPSKLWYSHIYRPHDATDCMPNIESEVKILHNIICINAKSFQFRTKCKSGQIPHLKQQNHFKIIKRWYYPPQHRLNVNVVCSVVARQSCGGMSDYDIEITQFEPSRKKQSQRHFSSTQLLNHSPNLVERLLSQRRWFTCNSIKPPKSAKCNSQHSCLPWHWSKHTPRIQLNQLSKLARDKTPWIVRKL